MIRTMIKRAAISAPVSIIVSQIISLCISLSMGRGEYFPVHPGFAALFQDEITPVVVQLLLIGLVSAVFAASSVIFDFERWGFFRQGALHFAITAAVLMPVIIICWRPINAAGVIITAASLLFTYSCTWFSRYLVWRHEIRKLNAKIQSVNREA